MLIALKNDYSYDQILALFNGPKGYKCDKLWQIFLKYL